MIFFRVYVLFFVCVYVCVYLFQNCLCCKNGVMSTWHRVTVCVSVCHICMTKAHSDASWLILRSVVAMVTRTPERAEGRSGRAENDRCWGGKIKMREGSGRGAQMDGRGGMEGWSSWKKGRVGSPVLHFELVSEKYKDVLPHSLSYSPPPPN